MKRISLIFSVFLTAMMAQAQEKIHHCITDELYFEDYLKKSPDATHRLEEALHGWEVYKKNPVFSKKQAVYRIPVVFHVIHEYGTENISKAQIEDQLRMLNEDFRRTNADAVNTRPVFQGVAADCQIEFVLATRDPQGNCTEGINRVYSKLTNNARDNVKSVSYWPSDKYLNVWVVKSIENSGDIEGTTLGYAQFPWDRNSRPTTDGIVLRSDYVGTIGTSSTAKAGRVATHEVGHWLGLFHTFQGGCNPPSWGENIDDTPPVSGPSYGCIQSSNTCTNDVPDLPDQIENYMDYSNGNCQNMFTYGQANLMDYVLNTYRTVLISASNATNTGINGNTSTCVPKADFSNAVYSVCAGGQVSFTDLSYNATITSRTWTFQGGTPATSSVANPTITFNTPGTYNVSLQVGNNNGNNTFSRNAIVIVHPTVSGIQAPVSEGMEGSTFPPTGWAVENGFTSSWQKAGVGASGSSSALAVINTSTPDGTLFGLITDSYDMINIKDPQLTFKAAHAARNATTIERLRVYASTDCGRSWVLIFQRAGTQLQTAPATTANFVPTASQWREYNVSLNNYVGRRNLVIKFEVQSNAGNNVYLDDINIGSISSTPEQEVFKSGLTVYPNPAAGEFNLDFELIEAGKIRVEVLDLMGRQVLNKDFGFQASGAQTIQIPGSELSNGMYLIRMHVGETIIDRKLMIQH